MRVDHLRVPATKTPGSTPGIRRSAASSAATSSLVSSIAGARMMSASCVRLVALAIGAVMSGRAISQASEICAGVAPWRAAT
jgi:hypothetical protein